VLNITPDILAGAYDFLRCTQPFKAWKLPHSDDIEFHVTKDKSLVGHYARSPRKMDHEIGISAASVSQTNTLIFYMGHEMIHLYQAIKKTDVGRTMHNAEFIRLANQVCSIHGWDAKLFI
jgi:hypothetical protein